MAFSLERKPSLVLLTLAAILIYFGAGPVAYELSRPRLIAESETPRGRHRLYAACGSGFSPSIEDILSSKQYGGSNGQGGPFWVLTTNSEQISLHSEPGLLSPFVRNYRVSVGQDTVTGFTVCLPGEH